MKNFPGPFQSQPMLKYKENTALTEQYSGRYTIAACFPFEPVDKCMTFQDIFPGLCGTLSSNFHDFPGSK